MKGVVLALLPLLATACSLEPWTYRARDAAVGDAAAPDVVNVMSPDVADAPDALVLDAASVMVTDASDATVLDVFDALDVAEDVSPDTKDASSDAATDRTDDAPDDGPDDAPVDVPADLTAACSLPRTPCGALCTDTNTDVMNCGRCGAACSSAGGTPSCVSGACGIACNANLGNCDSDATNGCETDLQTASNCGRCGASCPSAGGAASCIAGTCALVCNPGMANCNSSLADGCETDVRVTLTSCGSCGGICNVRNATAACVGGACAVASCNAGFADCNASALDGCEINVNTDTTNCMRCGNACVPPAGRSISCQVGACVAGVACASGLGDCDSNGSNGCETNLNNNANGCGACGRACNRTNGTPTCAGGVCTSISCDFGFGNCDSDLANGCEVDVRTSSSNCGMCGHACTGGQTCMAGSCVCPTGQTYCDGVCVDVQADYANCGVCGRVCPSPQVCVSGSCAATCGSGLTNCSRMCRNLISDSDNCGACGRRCSIPQICRSSVCRDIICC